MEGYMETNHDHIYWIYIMMDSPLVTVACVSSVSIATDYGLDDPGSNPGGDEIFRPFRPDLPLVTIACFSSVGIATDYGLDNPGSNPGGDEIFRPFRPDLSLVTVACISSVSIATDYGLDDPGSNPGGDEIFRPFRPALEPTQSSVKWVPSLSQRYSAARACRWPLTPF